MGEGQTFELYPHARIQRVDRVSGPPCLENHTNKGFFGNTDPDPLEYHNATKPDSMLGRNRHASKTAFRFGPMMARL